MLFGSKLAGMRTGLLPFGAPLLAEATELGKIALVEDRGRGASCGAVVTLVAPVAD